MFSTNILSSVQHDFSTLLKISNVLQPQISILESFLKDDVTLKTGLMKLKMHHIHKLFFKIFREHLT